MSGIEFANTFEPRIDQLSQKVQEIRQRGAIKMDATMDGAMNVVEQNVGRSEAREADTTMQALAEELRVQGAAVHGLDAGRVADLISDPFEDI